MITRASFLTTRYGGYLHREVPEEDDKVVDLMEALKKSLKGGGGPSRDKADRFLEAQARKARPKKKASSGKRAA